MADLLQCRSDVYPRLVRVKLPYMKVHEERSFIRSVPMLHSPLVEVIRNLPQVHTTGDRQQESKAIPGRKWKLQKLPALKFMRVDEPAPWLLLKRTQKR